MLRVIDVRSKMFGREVLANIGVDVGLSKRRRRSQRKSTGRKFANGERIVRVCISNDEVHFSIVSHSSLKTTRIALSGSQRFVHDAARFLPRASQQTWKNPQGTHGKLDLAWGTRAPGAPQETLTSFPQCLESLDKTKLEERTKAMNLRDQIDTLQKATVIDRDGNKIGSVGQVYLHNSTGEPSWVTVNTGLFGSNETFIPLDEAQLSGDEITVPYEKDFVKDAPNISEDGELSPEQENELYSYYGVKDPGYGTETTGTETTGTAGEVRDDRDLNQQGLADNAAGNESAEGVGTAGVATAGTAGTAGVAGAAGNEREGVAETDATRGVAADQDRREAGDVNDEQKITLHEEQVNVGTEKVETGRVRLRKHVVTETKTVEVPVEREEFVVERTPATGTATDAPLGEDEVEVSISEERPVVNKETVATEDVHVGTRTVQDTEKVATDVAHEEVAVDGVDAEGNRKGDTI